MSECWTKTFLNLIDRSETVQMQSVREIVHAEVFVGVALFEGARCAAPVRVQGEEDKGVRVRGVRPHHERAGGPLSAPEGQAPVQSGPAQVLRQASL